MEWNYKKEINYEMLKSLCQIDYNFASKCSQWDDVELQFLMKEIKDAPGNHPWEEHLYNTDRTEYMQ